MDQRLSSITLAVRDLAASHSFYADGLGWEPALHQPGEVLMSRVADRVVLSLWDVAWNPGELGRSVLP